MNEENFIQGFGANESHYDARTISHDVTLAVPLIKGGHDYLPSDIEHQHKVGICTAISLTQNAGKYFGKKFSADFQYLLQKKYYDLGWWEGSSIFNALKVGKNYGFLSDETFNKIITEDDRSLPYPDYVAKLQSIPDDTIKLLLTFCEHKLTGYAQIDVSDPQLVAKGINDSKSGILCRYTAGESWYTAKNGKLSWASIDIDPLRVPTQSLSGHAIGAVYFDYTINLTQTLANTWGTEWNDQNKGNAHVNWSDYKMTEAWIPYYDFTPTVPLFTHSFQIDIKYGQKGDEIVALQKALSTIKYFIVNPTGYYGDITAQAVLAFQKDKVSLSWYEQYILRGKLVGLKTRQTLNLIFNK